MFSNCLHTPFLQGLKHFDEILQEADGIILSRGNLGIDLPPEKVRLLGLLFISIVHISLVWFPMLFAILLQVCLT